jgi:ubiquinone/menaquinone biosynthesis C-methylase UbiE
MAGHGSHYRQGGTSMTHAAASISTSAETDRIRHHYDKSAATYDREMRFWERLLFGDGRSWICSQAAGRVLEIAIGTGRNLRFYSSEVALTGVELSPAMLDLARTRAAKLGLAVDLTVGDAQALDFPDASFDTVVCTLSLCSIPDDRRTIAEVRRVLRSDGRLLLLEHVRSPSRLVRSVQRVLDPFAVWASGDHLMRDPLDYLESAGFDVVSVERSKAGIVERVAARKP